MFTSRENGLLRRSVLLLTNAAEYLSGMKLPQSFVPTKPEHDVDSPSARVVQRNSIDTDTVRGAGAGFVLYDLCIDLARYMARKIPFYKLVILLLLAIMASSYFRRKPLTVEVNQRRDVMDATQLSLATSQPITKRSVKVATPLPPPPAPPEAAKPSLRTVNFGPIRSHYGAQLFNVTNAENLTLFKDLEPTIPHIIHQTWKSNMVAQVSRPWIQSILDLHPDWEYYFWTDDDIECFLEQNYSPQHLENFKNYPQGIFRADALR